MTPEIDPYAIPLSMKKELKLGKMHIYPRM